MADKRALANAVTKNPATRTWDFHCPGVRRSACGDPETGPFSSTGWPSKDAALERGREHFGEHLTGTRMSTLADFRAKHGLGVDTDGNAITLKDLEDLS